MFHVEPNRMFLRWRQPAAGSRELTHDERTPTRAGGDVLVRVRPLTTGPLETESLTVGSLQAVPRDRLINFQERPRPIPSTTMPTPSDGERHGSSVHSLSLGLEWAGLGLADGHWAGLGLASGH